LPAADKPPATNVSGFRNIEEDGIAPRYSSSVNLHDAVDPGKWQMAKYHVTLKANLSDGELYWVADVAAGNEDDAMAAAEALFARQLESAAEWSFAEADVERL